MTDLRRVRVLPLYELGVKEPVAHINNEGQLDRDPVDLPRILFADIPFMLHLTCGISLSPKGRL